MMTGGGVGLRGRERVGSFPLLSWRMWYVVWGYTHFCCVHTHKKLQWVFFFTPFCPPPLSVFLPPSSCLSFSFSYCLPSLSPLLSLPLPISPPPPPSLPLLVFLHLLSLPLPPLPPLPIFSPAPLPPLLFPSLSLSSQALTPTLGSHGTMEILTETKL